MARVHTEISDEVILTRARNFGFAQVDENPELKQNLIFFARAVIQDDRDQADTYTKAKGEALAKLAITGSSEVDEAEEDLTESEKKAAK